MKKSFVSLLLMLISALVINAQSLTGKQWFTVFADEDGVDIVLSLIFEENGSCELVMATEFEMQEDDVPITFTCGVTIPGTFRLNGQNLKMNLNKRKAEVELDYEFKGMDAKTKSLMDKELEPDLKDLKKEFKKEMIDGLPPMGNMKIISLETSKLVLRDEDGNEIPFFCE